MPNWLRAGRSRDRITLGGTRPDRPDRPDRPWSSPNLVYVGCQVSFSGVKRPGRGVNHPTPPSSAKVIGRVELYLYVPTVHLVLHGLFYLYHYFDGAFSMRVNDFVILKLIVLLYLYLVQYKTC